MSEQAIIEAVRELVLEPSPNRLWSTDDIAKYTGYSQSYVKNKIVNQPEFPAPIRLAKGSDRRWPPKKVIKFAESKQSKN